MNFVLPKLSRARADLEQQVFQSDSPLIATIGEREFIIRPVTTPLQEELEFDAADTHGIEFNLNKRKAYLLIQRGFMDAVCRVALPQFELDQLESDAQAFATDLVFGPLLSQIEDAVSAQIRIQAIDVAPEGNNNWRLDFEIHDVSVGNRHRVIFLAGRSTAELIAMTLGRRVPSLLPQALVPVCVSLRVGSTPVTLSELRDLRLGDLIIVAKTRIADDIISVVVQERLRFAANLEASGRVTLLEQHPSVMNEEVSIEDDSEALDALPIELVFELGRLTLTIGELRELTAGRSLELDRDLQAPVELVVNGKRIGRGELVQIENRLGVRVKEISGRAAS